MAEIERGDVADALATGWDNVTELAVLRSPSPNAQRWAGLADSLPRFG
jgi:hypothetical protein